MEIVDLNVLGLTANTYAKMFFSVSWLLDEGFRDSWIES